MKTHDNHLSLDTTTPDKVVWVLLRAAQEYEASAKSLIARFEDTDSARPWKAIAKRLKTVATLIEHDLKRMGVES